MFLLILRKYNQEKKMKTFKEIADILSREENRKYTSSEIYYMYEQALNKMRRAVVREWYQNNRKRGK